jgi:regulator-associated protein of mTOR
MATGTRQGVQSAQFARMPASSPAQSQSQSRSHSAARANGPRPRQTPLDVSHFGGQIVEGSTSAVSSSQPFTNGSRNVNGNRPSHPHSQSRSLATVPVPLSHRPLSAPGNKPQLRQSSSFSNAVTPIDNDDDDDDDDDDDGDDSRPVRPSKPPLLRSKSDHIGLHRDDGDRADEQFSEWGARHGFEDHYQSEDIISQLANVGHTIFTIFVKSEGGEKRRNAFTGSAHHRSGVFFTDKPLELVHVLHRQEARHNR